MEYNLSLLKNICRLSTTTFLYLIIFCIIICVYEEQLAMPQYLLGIPVILVSFFLIERYIFHPVAYILLHLSVLPMLYFFPFEVVAYRYLYYILLFFEGIHAINVWKQKVEKPYDEAPWGIYLIMVFVYCVTTAYHYDVLSNFILACGVLLLLLHFLRLYIEGAGNVLKKTKYATSVPTKRMMLTSFSMVLLLIIIFLLATAFIHIFHLEQYFRTIGAFLVQLVRFIASLIFYGIAIIRALLSTKSTVSEQNIDEKQIVEAYEILAEPSTLAKIINTVFIIAFFVILSYLCIRLFAYVIRLFFHRYASDTDLIVTLQNTANSDKKTVHSTPIIEKIQQFFTKDDREKIRHGYRIKINSYKANKTKPCDTPYDIANDILKDYKEDIFELTDVYEKARYSNEEITFEDVKKGGLL